MVAISLCLLFVPLLQRHDQSSEIRSLMDLLRSEKIEERQAAARELVKIGARAIPELEKTANDNDSDVAGHARDIIKSIREFSPATASLSGEGPFNLVCSPAGKFIVVRDPLKVVIFDATSLKTLKALESCAAAVGFTSDDSEIIIVGKSLVHLRTSDWEETFHADPPNIDFNQYGQAWVSTTGEIYYRRTGGGLSLATVSEKRLVIENLGTKTPELEDAKVSRILGKSGNLLILTLEGQERAALCNKRAVYWPRAQEKDVVAAGVISGQAILVCKQQITAYNWLSWNPMGAWKQPKNAILAAFDETKGRVFLSDGTRMEVINMQEPEKAAIYEPVNIVPSVIAINSKARLLFMISDKPERMLYAYTLRN